MTYDPDKHDGLIIVPKNDGFSQETPLRAFTDWTDYGRYAIGKGFRPAVQHLPAYLDAIEIKEGWQLGQLFTSPDGRPSAAWFRRPPGYVMSPEQSQRIQDEIAVDVAALPVRPTDVRTGEYHKSYQGVEPIPELVYWNGEDSNFYGKVSRRGQGQKFFDKWYPRRAEFPTTSHEDDKPSCIEAYGMPSPRKVAEDYAAAPSYRVSEDEGDDGLGGDPATVHATLERLGKRMADDPINPRHYGGTHCADIGERMTANCYQVLKYCWRLGEKDDPVQELGKAIWYAAREKLLGPSRSRGSGPLPGMKQDFVLERTEDSPWRREIAMLLWDMCYGFGTPAHWHCAADELVRVLQEKKREMTPSVARGRAMEP